jgi:hypothetical protein
MKATKKIAAIMLLLNATLSTAQPVISEIPSKKKIQVLICLDVSGSMSGLIGQAKDQLWNMVSVMGKAKNNDETPEIEIALYEYGRPSNGVHTGYVKRINGFTSDLDLLSKNLFGLTIDGGDEFCGHVMYTALSELNWDPSPQNYKVLFIAGNEDFFQGNTHYTKACQLAAQKGVIINTIYCGNRQAGIAEHWDKGAECSQGSFTNIDHNATVADIATPYDSTLFVLNKQLNTTYVSYGEQGSTNLDRQNEVDELNETKNKSAALKRVSVKGSKSLYNNSSWDLVDAYTGDTSILAKIDKKTLPDSLEKKSNAELLQIVNKKKEERVLIQKDIESLSKQRSGFIAAEKSKSTSGQQQTLESEVEKMIIKQAKKFDWAIE